MKNEDIIAIQNMNPQAHWYLEVVGTGVDQHLSTKQKNFFGRLWMKLGFSSASMKNVAQYILKNAENFSDLNREEIQNFNLFKEKLEHYVANHHSLAVSRALAILNQPISLPLTSSDSEFQNIAPLPDLSPEEISNVQVKNQMKEQFIEKFNTSSGPSIYPLQNKRREDIQALFAAESERLEQFFKEQSKKDFIPHDLIYVCMGVGNEHEQVWPGFIFDALARDQKVLTLMFEFGWKYPENTRTAFRDMNNELCKQSIEIRNSVESKLNHFSVQQFLCGMPFSDQEVNEELTEDQKQHVQVILGHYRWETRTQVNNSIAFFNTYLENLLKQGKQVIIGNHMGFLPIENSLLQLYNDLIKKYPDQIHYLWGWGKLNWFTHQEITDEDLAINQRGETPPNSIWTFYDHLKSCFLS